MGIAGGAEWTARTDLATPLAKGVAGGGDAAPRTGARHSFALDLQPYLRRRATGSPDVPGGQRHPERHRGFTDARGRGATLRRQHGAPRCGLAASPAHSARTQHAGEGGLPQREEPCHHQGVANPLGASKDTESSGTSPASPHAGRTILRNCPWQIAADAGMSTWKPLGAVGRGGSPATNRYRTPPFGWRPQSW